MLEKIKHPIVILLLKFAALYLLWFLFYEVWLRQPVKVDSENQKKGALTEEKTSALDNWIIKATTKTAAMVLTGLGQDIFFDGFRTIGIQGTGGLWVGDSCNAISLIALFIGIILILNGIWWHKLIYIFIGSIMIWLLNVFRVVLLAFINTQSVALTEFNHTYTFTIIIYAFIIFLWYWWIKKYADIKSK